MPFTKNFRTPAQLSGVARAAFRAELEKHVTNGLLPLKSNFALTFDFGVGQSALPPAARYRSFNTESDVNVTSTAERRQGKLPPISIRLHVDEFQQLEMMGQNDAIGAEFERYATLNAQSIAARVVLAQAQAITDGAVTITDRGMSFAVDFARNVANTANAAIAWSSVATAKPLTDLEALRAAINRSLDRIILSQQAMTYLQTNVDLIKISLQRGTDLPSRISVEDVRAVFRDYGLGEIEINTDKVINNAGAEIPLFAADKVVIISGGAVGRTDLGVTAESTRADAGISRSEAPGVFAGAMESDDPSGYNVLASAIVLPVVTSANNTAVLDAF